MGESSGIRADISLTTIAEQLRAAIDDLTVPHKKRSSHHHQNDRFLFKRKILACKYIDKAIGYLYYCK